MLQPLRRNTLSVIVYAEAYFFAGDAKRDADT